MEMEEANLEQTTKEAVNASINNYQDPLLDDAWNDEESFISVDETVDDAGEKTEVTEAGKENEDLSDTGVIGATEATEESSTSTTGGDKAVEEDNRLTVEKG